MLVPNKRVGLIKPSWALGSRDEFIEVLLSRNSYWNTAETSYRPLLGWLRTWAQKNLMQCLNSLSLHLQHKQSVVFCYFWCFMIHNMAVWIGPVCLTVHLKRGQLTLQWLNWTCIGRSSGLRVELKEYECCHILEITWVSTGLLPIFLCFLNIRIKAQCHWAAASMVF